jgi:hypothetical protein
MRTSLLFATLLLLSFFSCTKPTALLQDNVQEDYKSPTLSHISIYDTIPGKFLNGVSIKEYNGVKALHQSGRYTCYFQYDANAEAILRVVGSLPFRKTDFADSLCRKIERTFSLTGKTILSDDEVNAASFFWTIDPEQFTYYECLKGQQRHTLLINNTTGTILHRIEGQEQV